MDSGRGGGRYEDREIVMVVGYSGLVIVEKW